MKYLLLISIIGVFSFMCASSKLDKQMQERFLIRVQAKIIDNGYFEFLQLKDFIPVRKIIFHYGIDKKHNEFSVYLLENKEVKPRYSVKGYEGSEEWNTKERNTYREEYYKIIDENFLQMSNEEKFRLLDSLTKGKK